MGLFPDDAKEMKNAKRLLFQMPRIDETEWKHQQHEITGAIGQLTKESLSKYVEAH